MKHRLLLPIFLLAMIVCLPAETLDYISLLEAALVHDAESASLDLTVKRSEHRLQTQLYQSKQGVQQWRLGSSQLILEAPFGWTFNPGYSYTKPDSWSVDISGMFGGTLLAAEETNQPLPGQSNTRFQATPAIQFGIPLWQRNYQSADTIRELRQQLYNSRLLAAQRALALERELIGKLSRLTAAESSLQKALSEEAKARQQIEKARRLDGAQEGGTVLLSLQRSLASSQSKLRQAEINRNRASQELSAFCGMEVSANIATLAIPQTSLTQQPDELDGYPAYMQAMNRLNQAREILGRPESPASLRAEAGAELRMEPGSDEAFTPRVHGGLNYSSPDGQAALSLAWDRQSGASLNLSLAWKPQDKATITLENIDTQLSLAEADLQFRRDLQQLQETVQALERQREDLLLQEEDLAISLDFAREQLAIYELWMNRGVVDQAEYEEVQALLAELDAQEAGLNLDKRLWELMRQELWLRITEEEAQ